MNTLSGWGLRHGHKLCRYSVIREASRFLLPLQWVWTGHCTGLTPPPSWAPPLCTVGASTTYTLHDSKKPFQNAQDPSSLSGRWINTLWLSTRLIRKEYSRQLWCIREAGLTSKIAAYNPEEEEEENKLGIFPCALTCVGLLWGSERTMKTSMVRSFFMGRGKVR